MIANITERSIPCEYSTSHHCVLWEKIKINSKIIIQIHNHTFHDATKGATIFKIMIYAGLRSETSQLTTLVISLGLQ